MIKIKTTDFNYLQNVLPSTEIPSVLIAWTSKVTSALSQLKPEMNKFHDYLMEKHKCSVSPENTLVFEDLENGKKNYDLDVLNGLDLVSSPEIDNLKEYLVLLMAGIEKGEIVIKISPTVWLELTQLVDSLTDK